MRNRFALSALIILLALFALVLAGCEKDRPVPTPNANIATAVPTSAAEAGTPAGATGAATPVPMGGTSSVEQPEPATPTSEAGATSTGTEGTAGTQGTGAATTYVIKSGDTLSSIARQFGVTATALRSANPAITNPNVLVAGTEIVIPAQGTATAGSGQTTGQGATEGATSTQPIGGYTVQRGDTLGSIAQKFGVTVKELQELNNISDPDTISLGQQLRIPGAPSSSEGTSSEGTPSEGSSSGGTSDGETYVVQQGDTLNSIATRYGITTAELQDANGISDPDLIYPGQVLVIP